MYVLLTVMVVRIVGVSISDGRVQSGLTLFVYVLVRAHVKAEEVSQLIDTVM